MTILVKKMQSALRAAANPEDAVFLQRFFKTGPGQYGEGDRFLGVRVPATRKIVKQFPDATLHDAVQLLKSEWHEERLLGLLTMVRNYQKGDTRARKDVYDAYLAHTAYINNWDLVDASAEHVVGPQLHGTVGAKRLLMKLAKSDLLWERRIAMLSAFHFIKQQDFTLALEIADQLLHDDADLIHKAVGWMLREIGNRDQHVLEEFLRERATAMPRTMLRYAIERLPEARRRHYMRKPS